MVYSILIGFMLLLLSATLDAIENVLKHDYNNTWLRYYLKGNIAFKRFLLRSVKYLSCVIGYGLLGMALISSTSNPMAFALVFFIILCRLIYILLYNYLVNVTFKI